MIRICKVGFAAALAAAMSAGLAAPARASTAPAPVEVTVVTSRDIATSNAKAKMAYEHLARMWSAEIDRIGGTFDVPALARYRGTVATACGAVGSGNAAYCPRDNTIYYDEVFLAGQARRAARELRTDGDMAAVGVIAHEMGHAVAMQLGHASRITYLNESTADCLAGAFARQADRDGSLEPGDIQEAFYGMYTAGDPPPELTGNPRADRRIRAQAALMGHGTYAQRMQNFRTGLRGGPGACLEEFEASR
jgi:uncharacterized protein